MTKDAVEPEDDGCQQNNGSLLRTYLDRRNFSREKVPNFEIIRRIIIIIRRIIIIILRFI